MPDWWYSHELFGQTFIDPDMTVGWWWVMCSIFWLITMIIGIVVNAIADNKQAIRVFSLGATLTFFGPVAIFGTLLVSVVMFMVELVRVIYQAWRN